MRIGKTEAEKLIYGVTTFTWLLLAWIDDGTRFFTDRSLATSA
jgi:hypothetical protein